VFNNVDSLIVVGYFFIISISGYFVSRHFKSTNAVEFITGRRTLKWYQTSLTVIAMAVDPGIIGLAGLGFLWGMYPTQWNAVHVWITTWVAAMFFVPIYWRTKIYTTPELLEKRFNVQCRVFFSIVMISVLVVTLAFGVYLGALLLKNFFGWSFWVSILLICAVAGFYVIMGGMRTVLAIDFYQAIYLLITIGVVAGMALYKIGGISGLASIKLLNKAGTLVPSTIPPNDWNLYSTTFYPLPAMVTWAVVVGLSWLICNFGMVQRLLAAKSERDAQKALLLVGIFSSFVCISGYISGTAMRVLMPDIKPDESFIRIVLTMFPAGIRGLLVAGIIAALLSTIDGMMTASSALAAEDIYLRFIRPGAKGNELKIFTRIVQAVTIIIAIAIIPFFMKSQTAMEFLQNFYGDVLGVVVALYLVGIFTKRATPKAAFFSMVTGIGIAVYLDLYTSINFSYVGMISFLYALMATIILSRFESPVPEEKLVNLTVHTLPDTRKFWVGLTAWPNLWKWALGLAAGWFALSLLWEWYVWIHQV